eukprot:COSAG02_NODE_32444_length_516_cov_0.863309_1_plen_156_part_10
MTKMLAMALLLHGGLLGGMGGEAAGVDGSGEGAWTLACIVLEYLRCIRVQATEVRPRTARAPQHGVSDPVTITGISQNGVRSPAAHRLHAAGLLQRPRASATEAAALPTPDVWVAATFGRGTGTHRGVLILLSSASGRGQGRLGLGGLSRQTTTLY